MSNNLRSSDDHLFHEIQKALKYNIVAFWYPRCIDNVYGGYIIHYGPKGEDLGPGTKMIVSQARMLWLFSRLAIIATEYPEWVGEDTATMLKAAQTGYDFLVKHMWDEKNGGFYWEVDATGTIKLKVSKHLYGEACALYALSEYYRASRQSEVLECACKLFTLLETKAHDGQHGGYLEFFDENWRIPTARSQGYLGDASQKLMNTHLHMLEAVTTFYSVNESPLVRDRLLELIRIQTSAVVRRELGACTDKHHRTWTPRLEPPYARVSYGHDVENVWLVMDACEAAQIDSHQYLDLFRSLWAYSLKYGYDEVSGGFWESGAFHERADRRSKIWWVQAEALVSAVRMWQMTSEERYRAVFEATWSFLDKHQIDWQFGEWHHLGAEAGTVSRNKASVWKEGYHTGRAMLECLLVLARSSALSTTHGKVALDGRTTHGGRDS